MGAAENIEEQKDTLQLFIHILQQGDIDRIEHQLEEMHPAEIAHLLESLPTDQRHAVWEHVPAEMEGEVLTNVNEDVRAALIERMDSSQLLAATETLDTDDLADILPEMPQDVIQELLLTMEQQDRDRLRSALSFDEDSAGGLMNLDAVMVCAGLSLDVVQRYLRRRGEIPEGTDNLYVVDRENHYIGSLPLITLLTRDPSELVEDVMLKGEEAISAETPARDVALRFKQRDLISAPVVDVNGILLGRITIDDVVDVIRDEAERDYQLASGITTDVETTDSPARLSRARAVVRLASSMSKVVRASGSMATRSLFSESLIAVS